MHMHAHARLVLWPMNIVMKFKRWIWVIPNWVKRRWDIRSYVEVRSKGKTWVKMWWKWVNAPLTADWDHQAFGLFLFSRIYCIYKKNVFGCRSKEFTDVGEEESWLLKGNSGIFKPRPYFWHEIRSSTHREQFGESRRPSEDIWIPPDPYNGVNGA